MKNLPARSVATLLAACSLMLSAAAPAQAPAFETRKLSDNVFLKKFVNRSQITLRYSYHNADRVRGIPADILCGQNGCDDISLMRRTRPD